MTECPQYEAALSPRGKPIGSPTSPTTVQSPRTPQQTVPVSPLTERRMSVRHGAFVPEHNLPRKTNKIAGWSHKVVNHPALPVVMICLEKILAWVWGTGHCVTASCRML